MTASENVIFRYEVITRCEIYVDDPCAKRRRRCWITGPQFTHALRQPRESTCGRFPFWIENGERSRRCRVKQSLDNLKPEPGLARAGGSIDQRMHAGEI